MKCSRSYTTLKISSRPRFCRACLAVRELPDGERHDINRLIAEKKSTDKISAIDDCFTTFYFYTANLPNHNFDAPKLTLNVCDCNILT